jgi:hypothetical protein
MCRATKEKCTVTIINYKLVLECRKLLMSLAEANLVTHIWVPGHTNVQNNKKADVPDEKKFYRLPSQ